MKGIIAFGFFLLFLAGIALVNLKGSKMVPTLGGGAEVTGVRWRPILVGGDTIPDDSGMFIQFEVDGSIKGHGGCNGFFGSLEQKESGIGVGALGATSMACPEPVMSRETTYLDAIQKTRNFDTGSADMRLLDEENEVLAEFVAED